MLELHINPNISDSVFPVRWCVDKDIIKKLREQDVENPHILLISRDEGGRETRQLVPLTQGLAYLEFYRPGPHTLYAMIVYSEFSGEKGLRKRWLGLSGPKKYDQGLFDSEDQFRPDWYGSAMEMGVAEIALVIPDGCFAKEPPEWERAWVNMLFEAPPLNQCLYRRRRILAYTLQPFLLAAFLMGKLVAAIFLLLCGMRGVNLASIFHPLTHGDEDFWKGKFQAKWCVFRTKNDRKTRRPFWFSFFIPIIPISVGLVLLQLNRWVWEADIAWWIIMLGGILGYLISVIFLTGVIGIVVCFLWVMFGFVRVVVSIFDVPDPERARRQAEKARKEEEAFRERMKRLYEEEVAGLICTGQPMPVSVGALPPERQTLYLRYLELKAKVCKPFAR